MTKEQKQAIGEELMHHLEARLDEFWEHDVASGRFTEDRNEDIRFGKDTFRAANDRILAAAKERLDLTLILLGDRSLAPASIDRFVKPHLDSAKEVVQEAYREIYADCQLESEDIGGIELPQDEAAELPVKLSVRAERNGGGK
jgi:hypothetical protein